MWAFGKYVKDSRYSGLTLGVSIPLWGNSRTKVKQRKMERQVSELDLADVQTQLGADIRTRYATAQSLFETAQRLNEQIALMAKRLPNSWTAHWPRDRFR